MAKNEGKEQDGELPRRISCSRLVQCEARTNALISEMSAVSHSWLVTLADGDGTVDQGKTVMRFLVESFGVLVDQALMLAHITPVEVDVDHVADDMKAAKAAGVVDKDK